MTREEVVKPWLSGIRGTVVMILTWTVGWGLGFGGLAEVFVDPSGETLDIWPFELAIPGFIGGVVFAGLLRISEGRRSFDEVSLVRFAVLGVATGGVLGVLSVTTDGPIPLSLSVAELLGLATALSAVAAIGSAVFFRLLMQVRRPAAALRTG